MQVLIGAHGAGLCNAAWMRLGRLQVRTSAQPTCGLLSAYVRSCMWSRVPLLPVSAVRTHGRCSCCIHSFLPSKPFLQL